MQDHTVQDDQNKSSITYFEETLATKETAYTDVMFPYYLNKALFYGMPCIMATGIATNALSFITIVTSNTRKISTGVYLSVLAWFDSMLLVLWTSTFWAMPHLGAPFAGLLRKCNVLNFLMSASLGYCSMCVVCVTTDRFIAVYFPLTAKRFTTRKRAAIVLASLAVVMLACFGPALFSTNELCGSNGLIDVYTDTVMYLMAFTFYFHGPIIYLLCMNIAIAAKLCLNRKFFGKNKSRASTDNEKIPKAVVTVLVVSVVYVVLMLPYNVLMILATSINFRMKNKALEEIVVTTCRLMMVSNHGVNFFLYSLTSVEFRRSLVNLFRRPIRLVSTWLHPEEEITAVTAVTGL